MRREARASQGEHLRFGPTLAIRYPISCLFMGAFPLSSNLYLEDF